VALRLLVPRRNSARMRPDATFGSGGRAQCTALKRNGPGLPFQSSMTTAAAPSSRSRKGPTGAKPLSMFSRVGKGNPRQGTRGFLPITLSPTTHSLARPSRARSPQRSASGRPCRPKYGLRHLNRPPPSRLSPPRVQNLSPRKVRLGSVLFQTKPPQRVLDRTARANAVPSKLAVPSRRAGPATRQRDIGDIAATPPALVKFAT
jgi:hypothetical protein